MAKIRPGIEISGRYLVSARKIHIFSGRKNFGQNVRNFGPPAKSKLKHFEKYPKNHIFENFSNGQNSAGDRNFWPIFGFWPENTYLFRPKKFWTKRPKFRPSGQFQVKTFKKCPKNHIFENFSNGQNSAGDRNFWPIFGFCTENTYFFWPKKFWTKRPKFRPSGQIQTQTF